ncbi:MAG TPA: hypothetical protein VN848_10790 [Gemmatimonadales bacterium]|nr:hypothetical protein [Gemmatimonadales bacterium]
MRFVHHPAPLCTFLAATCLIVTAACTTLRPVEPDELRGPNPPERVRVTTTDDSTVVLRAPTVLGDTLIGTVDRVRRTFLLAQATAIQAWEPAPGRTAALVGGGAGALAFIVVEAIKTKPPAQPACGVCSYCGSLC